MSGVLSYLTALLVLVNLATGVLAGVRRADQRASRAGLALATVAAALLLALVRVNGLSAVDLLLSISPSLSVLLLGLALHGYMETVFRLPLLRPEELLWWSGFVLVLSVPLYASVLGLIPADLYAQGYRFSWVHAVAVGFGTCVAWRGHYRLAMILLGALAAQYFSLLPSGNIFDALTDGIAFFAALIVGAQCAGRYLKNAGRAGKVPPPAPVPAE